MIKKIIAAVALLIVLVLGYFAYAKYFKSNTGNFSGTEFLYINTGSTYADVIQVIKENNFVRDLACFEEVAKQMDYPNDIHPGRYELREGMGNYSIISILKGGKQRPVKLVINKLRTKRDIIRKFASNLEADSLELEKLFNNNAYLKTFDIDSNQIQCAIMPNTYELYWNTTADKAFEKIARTFQHFWTSERRQKAISLKLKIVEVITIASIVEEETNNNEEKPIIASVYLNRLKKGMALGADPTVKFAVGDFTLKRILKIHTATHSPYNTYLNTGLPPGPICTPSEKSIDAVLNAANTDYLFFCAKEDFSGSHNFAATYAAHLLNAKKYQHALDLRNIK